jgi:NAD(P)-dependent dehydrogenase (short-subunit alcohol dehydrogenase family)
MTDRLKGKIAVVTGAGSGIGAAMATRFCEEGAQVVAVDVSGDQNELASRLGNACMPYHADVSNSADVQAMLQATIARYGRLNILCNNAGIDGSMHPAAEYPEAEFDRVWSVTGRSVFLGMRYAVPLMLACGGGSIVNTASVASVVGVPNMVAYCTAKGAVLQMTRTFAVDYAKHGVRVNAILPGAIDTAITRAMPAAFIHAATQATPMSRVGAPSEMANLALFLASDEASFVTGAAMAADGGYTAI